MARRLLALFDEVSKNALKPFNIHIKAKEILKMMLINFSSLIDTLYLI